MLGLNYLAVVLAPALYFALLAALMHPLMKFLNKIHEAREGIGMLQLILFAGAGFFVPIWLLGVLFEEVMVNLEYHPSLRSLTGLLMILAVPLGFFFSGRVMRVKKRFVIFLWASILWS